MAVPGWLPRVVPKQAQPLIADGKVAPPGACSDPKRASTSAAKLTWIWGPDAKSFNPARWLGPDARELETNICTL
ncbi:uncharacterized protein LY79DRAFT_499808, partial [Colletotrichum navitas]